jgi:hypothetical protein
MRRSNILYVLVFVIISTSFYVVINLKSFKVSRSVNNWAKNNIADIDNYYPIKTSDPYISSNLKLGAYRVNHRYRKKINDHWIIIDLNLYLNEDLDKIIYYVPSKETIFNFQNKGLKFEP